jgi:hypothetical protein
MALTGGFAGAITGHTAILRDIEVPVLLLETETDEITFGYYGARQPDTDHIRLWDIAGASHADSYVLPPEDAQKLGCGAINDAPTHYAVAAGLRSLESWAHTGTPPPSAPRMDIHVVAGKPTLILDANGNSLGGIRLPAIAVPTAAYSGIPPAGKGGTCIFFGSTQPFSKAMRTHLYPTYTNYLEQYTAATARSIRDRYVLPEDRAVMLAEAAPATW